MKNKIPIFIISLKNSARLPKLIKRLNELNLKYKIFYGVTGKKLKKRIELIYDKIATIKNINRELSPSEIGTASSHLRIYKYIINKNINQAIIMEDDAYPSKVLKEWVKRKINVEDDKIISFYTYPSTGFINKKPYKKVLENKIGVHDSVTHSFTNSCYQINKYTCQKILFLTKNKVSGYADWPFLVNKHNIKLAITIPFIAVIDDLGISSEGERRNFIKDYYRLVKNYIPEKILSILRIPYYLSYIPFILQHKNKDFYYEHFSQKQLLRFINFFIHKYLDINKIYIDRSYYYQDIRKIAKKVYSNR